MSVLRELFLKSEIRKKSNPRVFPGWEKTSSICMVIPGESEFIKAARKFISDSGKQADIVTFNKDKTTVIQDVYISLNKKNFKITGIPHEASLQKLKSKKYDAVVCCDLEGGFELKSITLLLQYDLLVGASENAYSKYFDISIAAGKLGMAGFLEQVLKYMKMIKTL